ncbi:Phosphatidylinositol:ceramide phosphoinositol transferase (IPC synthase) [Marasmius sp. AFHP31]|nr:Phosphatidylinositol:ceramide phosphoinositol transferase (IPC synthase) [Marasmius sp. AFHP31]
MALSGMLQTLKVALIGAIGRLEKSLDPKDRLHKLQQHEFTWADSIYAFHLTLASFWIYLLPVPLLLKLIAVAVFTLGLFIPLTSQFLMPALPVLTYLLSFFSSRFIPSNWRPNISVVLLPTLESVLYGANISDILTRYTHPLLDAVAWFPYGVLHYSLPFILAIFVWLFRHKSVLHLWSSTLGYLMLSGVLLQLVFPCAAPWYELVYGLTPANYDIKGSPGGLIRIDRMFHQNGYTTAFTNSPLVFGAFPSLHSGAATLEALFLSHFFPQTTKYAWGYAGILYWATMYLTHHYLVDVVGGACMATAFFYLFLPDELKHPSAATAPPTGLSGNAHRMGTQRSKYAIYDLEAPSSASLNRGILSEVAAAADFELSSDEEEDHQEIRRPGSKASRSQSNERKGHRHTASIARLIRSDSDRRTGEEGWSPTIAPAELAAEGSSSRSASRLGRV